MRVSRFAIREDILFSILQGLKMGWGRWTWCVREHKNKLTLRKIYFFCIQRYIEGVKQDEKSVPDLLEAMMRPTDPVKEELRRISCKMGQFRSKITKIMVPTFWIPEM